MQLQEFWDRIGMCPQGRSAAEAAEREIAEPRTDPAAVRAACEMLFDAGTGEEGFKALQNALGEDADGIKTLACLARCAAAVHGAYARRGIADDIYAATMRFLSRFTAENLQKYGRPRLLNGWWFWRQLSMREFRLGALEYEMTHDETGRRCLSLHIPSDARLTQAELAASLQRAKTFFAEFYPPYAETEILCFSWLLSPALPALLPQGSRILYFQSNFEVLRHDPNADAALEWIFPDKNTPPADLPETTSLQKKVKALLLAGGSVGWTLGRLKEDAFRAG